MKLVLFDDDARTGLLRDGRVVDLSPALGSLAGQPAQWRMEAVIEAFDEYRPQFARLAERERGVPIDSVQVRAPLPRPRHLLCAFSNYLEREGVWLSRYITLMPGDVIACGTHHGGLCNINDGDRVDVEVDGLERLSIAVRSHAPRLTERWRPPGARDTGPAVA